MRDSVLWRKQSRIIMMLAETLHIDAERALNLFYTTKVYQQLSDPKYGLQLMSDDYILENLIEELRETENMNYLRNFLHFHLICFESISLQNIPY